MATVNNPNAKEQINRNSDSEILDATDQYLLILLTSCLLCSFLFNPKKAKTGSFIFFSCSLHYFQADFTLLMKFCNISTNEVTLVNLK
jgi:hypothetical protein